MVLSFAALVAVAMTLVALLAVSGWTLYRFRRERRYGSVVSVDTSEAIAAPLRSRTFGLVGRPDEVRRRSDGAVLPVEWKQRSSPRTGPPTSHRVQLYAYCLLVEENYGRAPPFGVLRYGDGREFRLPWNERARAELLQVLAAARRPYRGEATPTWGKCSGCRFRPGCDAAAV